MPVIQTSAVIGKNTDGSDITQDVDVLVWWRDVGQARFPRIAVMARLFLAIPAASATAGVVCFSEDVMNELMTVRLVGSSLEL